MEQKEKIWANGLTVEQTIEEFNRIYRLITQKHLKRYHCKHKVNVIYMLKDGKITEDDLLN